MTYLLVLIRLATSTTSNILQKQLASKGSDTHFVVAATYAIITLIGWPLLLVSGVPNFESSFWSVIVLAGVLDALGNIFLLLSLKYTDLSIFGPINAFKAIIAMGFAAVTLGEMPTTIGLIGMVIIIGGSYLLAPADVKSIRGRWMAIFGQRGVWYRVISLVFFAAGTVFLKKAVQSEGVIPSFYVWIVVGLIVTGPACAILSRGTYHVLKKTLVEYRANFASLALCISVMQICTLVVFNEMIIGYALALFQLSMVLHVIAGRMLFKERDFKRRLAGCLVMVAGSIVIVFFGN